MDVLRKVRDALSKAGTTFRQNVEEGQSKGRIAKTFSEKAKGSSVRQFQQEFGVVKSSHFDGSGREFVDPAKAAGVVGGHVDRGGKLAEYLDEGSKHDDDASDRNLDV